MTFKKGVSGNPKGRAAALPQKYAVYRAIVDPAEINLIKKGVEMALDGHERLLTFFLERIMPARSNEDAHGKKSINQTLVQINTIINEHEKEF